MTKLTWQRAVPSQTFGWSAAKSYCASLTLAGKGGWRLPNIRELLSLVDLGERAPSIDGTAFPGTPSTYFWSASALHGSSSIAWLVFFDYGISNNYGVSNKYRARWVR